MSTDSKTYILASNNKHKLVELKRILEPLGINVVTARDMNIALDDVEETGTTFAENALIKAKATSERTGLPAISDDSGLCVDALDGRPGIYSARYAGENASDNDKINKLLDEMTKVQSEQRTAHFKCSICCYFPDGNIIEATGVCSGTIGFEPVGEGGFGYDPVFMVGEKSFAQLSSEEKDKISHRGNALRNLKEKLTDFLEGNK